MNDNLIIYLTFATISTGAVVIAVILTNLGRIKREVEQLRSGVNKINKEISPNLDLITVPFQENIHVGGYYYIKEFGEYFSVVAKNGILNQLKLSPIVPVKIKYTFGDHLTYMIDYNINGRRVRIPVSL